VRSNQRTLRDSQPRSRRSSVAERTLRIGATLGVPAVLRSLGANPAAVLAEIGVDEKLFDDPSNRISFAARGRLLAHCAARTACPHFGLLVGQRAGLHSLGFVGLLLKTEPDVGRALGSLVRYFPLHVRGARMALEVDGDLAVLSYEIYQSRSEGVEQVGDGAVAAMINVMRELAGSDWKPIEARFAHRKPPDVRPFRSFVGAPLLFEAEQYAVLFSASWLARCLPGTDPQLRRLLQEHVDSLERQLGDDFPEQVRSMLRHALVTGRAKEDQIAAVFSIERRTLVRRLHASGTGFREVVDEVRFEIARQLLEDSTMDMAQIASVLGYSNVSAFTRAFRRWSGTTPAQWRSET